MKYLMKYLDASRHVLMKEIIESEGDIEYTLRLSCKKAVRRYEQMTKRLSARIPEVSPTRFFYELSGREGTVYSMNGNERIVTEIQVCTPVGFPMRSGRTARTEVETI